MNVLRRYLAAKPDIGPWTFGRLARIQGMGLASIVDVLTILARERTAPGPGRQCHPVDRPDESVAAEVAIGRNRMR